MEILGSLMLFWFVCALIGAGIAGTKGLNVALGFVLGLLLGPIGLLILAAMSEPGQKIERQVAAGQMKLCPRCAEGVQPAAKVCRYCGHEFT